MEDLIFRWIERFGFPAAMVVVLIIAVNRLFTRNESTTQTLIRLQETTVRSNDTNTDAVKQLTKAFKESLGSGPVCKAGESCQAAAAGDKIVAELRMMKADYGLSDERIMKVVNAFVERKKGRGTQAESSDMTD